MAKRDALTDDELAAILADEEQGAVGFRDSTLADDQEAALDYYYGEPFGDEEDGRSQVVTRDVAEVHDWMKPEVLRPFVAGDRVVSVSAPDKAQSDEITAALQHQFMVRCRGFRVLGDAFTDGALMKLGVVKAYCADEEVSRTETMSGLPEEALVLIEEDGGELIEATESEPDEAGATSYTVKVRYTTKRKAKRVENVPPEEFLFPKRCRSLETADYLAHRPEKTMSDLLEMGFDADKLAMLGSGSGDTDETDNRLTNRFETEDGVGDDNGGLTADPSMRKYRLCEEYVLIDADGDGKAERLQVFRVGRVILSRMEVDSHPFEAWTPFPMPHKLVGQSLADKVMDVQRVRSVLLRQGLDAMYISNAPRTFVHEDSITENTIEDLLTVRPNAIIRWKGEVPPTPMQTPFAAGEAFNMLEFMNTERDGRTGVSRYSQGMNADKLNQTATGASIIEEKGQQIKEFIARQFGEFVGRVMMKLYQLNVDYPEPLATPMGGQLKEAQPAEWPSLDDIFVVVSVGLGSGRKDARIAARMSLLEVQREGVQMGLVKGEHLYRGAAGLVTDMGLGEPSDYFLDPMSDEGKADAAEKAQQPPPVDPKVEEVRAKLELEGQKAEADMAMAQQRAAFDAESAQADLAMRREEAAAKLDIARETATLQAELAREKAQQELALADRKMEAEFALAERRMAMEERISMRQAEMGAAAKVESAKLSNNRPGGSLAQ